MSSADLSNECVMSRRIGVTANTERTKTFSNLVCIGKIHAAMRCVCDKEKDVVLINDDIDKKSGEKVSDVLQHKYPESRFVILRDAPKCDTHREILELLVTDENVETVEKSMADSAGPDGVDSSAISGKLLKYGGASYELRKSLANFMMWLSISYPP